MQLKPINPGKTSPAWLNVHYDQVRPNISQGLMLSGAARSAPSLKGGLHHFSQLGPIKDPHAYLWDNWGVIDKQGTLFRFALKSPKISELPGRQPVPIQPDERHTHAEIALYTASEHDPRWQDHGVVLSTSGEPRSWDSGVIWSGSALEYEDTLLLAYTGISQASKSNDLFQRIGLALYNPISHCLERLSANPILDPEVLDAEELGYDLTDHDGQIMAWRDPKLWKDPDDGALHIFFATKRRCPSTDGEGQTEAAIGHARMKNQRLDQWELLPPLNVPHQFAQIELPIIEKTNRGINLFFNTVSFDASGSRYQTFESYEAEEFDGVFRPIPGQCPFMILDGRYGYQFVASDLNGQQRLSLWFDDGDFSLSGVHAD